MTGPAGCCDPVIRAATLLATPYAFRLSVPDESAETCPIGAVVGTAPILLVPPGPTAETIRRAPTQTLLEGLARCVADDGGLRSHALLEIRGAVRPLPGDRRGPAAVALYDNLGREELLDAVVDHEWLLGEVIASTALWHLPQACVPVDLAEVAQARIDEVLRHSTRVCPRLNLDHPEIAEAMAGEPAWFVEVDRFGRPWVCTTGWTRYSVCTGTGPARRSRTSTSRSRTARCRARPQRRRGAPGPAPARLRTVRAGGRPR